MSRDARAAFADIDSFDPDRFVAHLTPDVKFTFGNGDPVIGIDGVRNAVSGFFSTIAGLTHHIRDVWDVAADVTVVKVDVEYRRKDGKTVFTPNADILRWDGDKVADWQIYIDLAPVYA